MHTKKIPDLIVWGGGGVKTYYQPDGKLSVFLRLPSCCILLAFVVGVFSGSVDNCRGGFQESCVGFCGRGGLKITSPPSRLTDPLTLSLDNLSRPDTVNREEL